MQKRKSVKKQKTESILVTGGSGFVGSHLVEKLVEGGNRVTIIDDFSNGRIENLKNVKEAITIIKGDISIPVSKLKKLLGGYQFTKIFNLACHPRSLSLSNPVRDLEVNALGTLNILEIARTYNKCKVVFTSNSGIYGEPQYLPINEKHIDNPTTPYDANKLVAEYYLKIYHRIYGIPIGICRLATVYGERQMAKPDWKPVIAEFAYKISKNISPVICWDGKQTRDLIYVKDVVQGLMKASQAETGDNIFILGTGVETSINQIYSLVCKALGKNVKPKRRKKMPGDIRRMQYSSKKAKTFFEFEPLYSTEEGIKQYVDWMMNNNE